MYIQVSQLLSTSILHEIEFISIDLHRVIKHIFFVNLLFYSNYSRFLAGLLWFQSLTQDVENETAAGFVFFSVSSAFVRGLFSSLIKYSSEFPIALNEVHSEHYRLEIYFLCELLIGVAGANALPLLSATISSLMAKKFSAGEMYWRALSSEVAVSLLAHTVGQSVGSFVAILPLTFKQATLLSSVYCVFSVLFAGYLRAQMGLLAWVECLSLLHYCFEAGKLCLIRVYKVDESHHLLNPFTVDTNSSTPSYHCNSSVLAYATVATNPYHQTLELDVIILLSVAIAFQLVTYFSLKGASLRGNN